MSRLLVSLQFLLILFVAFPSSAPTLTGLNVMLFVIGIVVLLCALLVMAPRTFTVMPEPKEQGELVTHGIYRLVRHPMYLAVLLCALAASMAYQETWKWVLSGLLMMVSIIKIQYEEQMLRKRYREYDAYRKKVKAIIPFIL